MAKKPPKPPYGPAQTITLSGTLTDGHKVTQHSFYCLAGLGAPTITGGWANWGVVGRPQRVGTTVIQGYDPMRLAVPLLFDSVAYPPIDGNSIEDDLDKLEWMGGRGRLYSKSPFTPGLGDSPLITIVSADSTGNPIPLVPFSCQAVNWVIDGANGGLSYDENPLRGPGGHRIRQAVTVNLLQHVPGPFDTGNDSPAKRAKARQGQQGKTYTVTTKPGLRTWQEIATRSAHNPGAATDIRDANRNTPKVGSVRSVHAQLPLHVKVKVPLSARK